MTAPMLQLPVKVLRSATAGRRPGDGTFRALTDGELFVNTQDRALCYLDASGALVTWPLDPAALAALAPSASPSFTGVPTAPTPAAGDGSAKLATTGYADRAVAAEASRAKAVEGTLAPLASPVLSGTPTAPTPGAKDASARLATTAYADAALATQAALGLPDNCGRLSVSSASKLIYSPFNGNQVVVNGAPLTIPSGGIAYTPASTPAGSTKYYLYLTASGIMQSTTGWVYATDGRKYLKNGNGGATLTARLLGMVYTDPNGNFVDSASFRGLANDFNRRDRLLSSGDPGSATSQGPFIEYAQTRMNFLTWGDEDVMLHVGGSANNSTANAIAFIGFWFGGPGGSQSGAYSSSFSSVANYSGAADSASVDVSVSTAASFAEGAQVVSIACGTNAGSMTMHCFLGFTVRI